MARRRVYIAPFLPDGNGYADFIEVTNDVEASSLGSISAKLDVSDYDIGVYTNSGVSLNLQNSQGKYSDVSNDNSVFQYKRGDSLVKITYDAADFPFFPGISGPGDIVGGEIEVFLGLLNDDSTVLQLHGQLINFNVLGLESILDRAIGPDWVDTPPTNNKVSTLLKAVVRQANLGATVPVWTIDDSQINPQNDITWDDISVFQNKTCRDIVNQLLEASNSVLYMIGTVPIVSARTPTTDIKFKFYGQGSSLGPENITDIQDIRTGLNRTFNFLTFANSSFNVASVDSASVGTYGARAKEIGIDGITTQATQQSIVDQIRLEFSQPKQEFLLVSPITPDLLQIPLLSKISIDYPLVPIDTGILPVYGIAIYDRDKFPANLGSFTVRPTDYYKVIGMEFDLANNQARLNLRAA